MRYKSSKHFLKRRIKKGLRTTALRNVIYKKLLGLAGGRLKNKVCHPAGKSKKVVHPCTKIVYTKQNDDIQATYDSLCNDQCWMDDELWED